MGHVNDLNFFQKQQRSLADYQQMPRQGFETLYEEATHRRHMMSMPLHDSGAGRPAVMRNAESFPEWTARHAGVWFAKREEIAGWALGGGKALTPRDVPAMSVE